MLWHEASGVIRDIGKDGVFVESDSIPSVASPLKLDVTLPAESQGRFALRLRGTGVVCHVRQKPLQTSGFGASVKFQIKAPQRANEERKRH